MLQLHNRKTFAPLHVHKLSKREKARAMESLIFLAEKRDRSVKARTCANGSTQRTYISREEAASPTAATESVVITGVVEAKQQRHVITLDIPNAFVQTPVPQGKDKIIMKIRGILVDILMELCPGVYDEYVTYEQGQKILYVEMLMALYGMLTSAILFYKKFRKDIEAIGFEVNPYDICVANRQVNGKQHTVTWHVDDVKSSHVNPQVNEEFYKWCESTYGSDINGHVKVNKGKKHDYLGMILDYSKQGCLRVDMRYYIRDMIKEFPYQIKKSRAPWTEKLFKVDKSAKKLDKIKKAIFHRYVMKCMFLCKRGRQDVNPAVGFLSTRVKEATEEDWKKLLKMMGFLVFTIDDVLTLEADDSQTLTWYIDAAFAVHPDMKSHTGATFTLGKGVICSDSTKQKVNTRSSTEAELIAVDDKISKVIWTKKFLEYQGFPVKLNIVYQDNESAIKLERNGKESSGKRTRHFDIRYFYVTDLISRKEVQVEYCPTDDMLADYMTKPTVGSKFNNFRSSIMNI